MRETRNRVEKVLLVVHLRSLIRRDLEVGRKRCFDNLLHEDFTELDAGLFLEAFPDGSSVAS